MNSLKKVPSGNHSRYPRRRNPVSGCPLTAALAAVGGKWKLIIVYWLAESPKHFAALRQLMPGISQKVLTQQLRELANDDGVQRHTGCDSSAGRVFTYRLWSNVIAIS